MSRGSIAHCAIIFAVVMVSACQLDFGDFSQFPNDDSDIVGPEADVDFDEAEMADGDTSDSSEPSSEVPDLDVVEEGMDDKVDDATEEMAEEDIEAAISCERNADCSDGWVCGTGAVCRLRCEEGGCQPGASCNPNNGLCEFCTTQCPTTQCCNINAPDNSPEFWYCGACCSPPCPEGTACMGGDECVELVCPEECDEAQYCAPETGYVCTRDPNYHANPAFCDTYLRTEGGLSLTSVQNISLRFDKLTDAIVAKGERGGQHIAALRSGRLVVYSIVGRNVTEVEPFGSSFFLKGLRSFQVDRNGSFHLLAMVNSGEHSSIYSWVYLTTLNGEWEIHHLSQTRISVSETSDLIVDSDSKVHFVWIDYSSDLHYLTNRQGFFTDETIENAGCSRRPFLLLTETGQPQIVCFRGSDEQEPIIAELGKKSWMLETWQPIPNDEESEHLVLEGSAIRDDFGTLHTIVLSSESMYGRQSQDAVYGVRTSNGWAYERVTVGNGLMSQPVIMVETDGEVRIGGVGSDGLLHFFTRRQGNWFSDEQSRSHVYSGNIHDWNMMRGGKWVASYLQDPGPLTYVAKDGEVETFSFLDSSDVIKTSNWVVDPDGRPSFMIAANEWTQSGWRNSLQLATVISNKRFEYKTIVSFLHWNQVQFTHMKLYVNSSGRFYAAYRRDDTVPSFQYSKGRDDVWITRPLPIPEQNEETSFVLKDMEFGDDGCLHLVFLRDREPYELVYNSMCDLTFTSENVVALDNDDPIDAWIKVDSEGNPLIAFSDTLYTALARREASGWVLEDLVENNYRIVGFGFDVDSTSNLYSSFYHENIVCSRHGCGISGFFDVLKIIRTSEVECYTHGNRTLNFAVDTESHFHVLREESTFSNDWKHYCTDRFGLVRCSESNPIPYLLKVDKMAVSDDGRVHILYSNGTRYASFLPIPAPEQPESTDVWYR